MIHVCMVTLGGRDLIELAIASLNGRTDFTAAAHALGRATAEVHTALAAALPGMAGQVVADVALTLGSAPTASSAPTMTVSAPATIAFAISPEYLMPPSAMPSSTVRSTDLFPPSSPNRIRKKWKV